MELPLFHLVLYNNYSDTKGINVSCEYAIVSEGEKPVRGVEWRPSHRNPRISPYKKAQKARQYTDKGGHE